MLNGARVDPANAITEANDDADDPSLDCTAVGEGSDAGDATEPDNFDCTSHTVGGGAGRHAHGEPEPGGLAQLRVDGRLGDGPRDGASCISGKFSIAYEWVDSAQVFHRFVPGVTELSNMRPADSVRPAVGVITAEGVTCQMPVAS